MEKFLVYTLFFIVFSTIPILLVYWVLSKFYEWGNVANIEEPPEEEDNDRLQFRRCEKCCRGDEWGCSCGL